MNWLACPLREECDGEKIGKAGSMCVRRVLVLIVGSIVLIGGIVMLALPGPGILGVIAGIAILSSEFPWARRWLEKLWQKVPLPEHKKRKLKQKLPVT